MRYGFFRIARGPRGTAAASSTPGASGRPPAEAIVAPATVAAVGPHRRPGAADRRGARCGPRRRRVDDPPDRRAHHRDASTPMRCGPLVARSSGSGQARPLPRPARRPRRPRLRRGDRRPTARPTRSARRLHRAQDEAAAGLIDLTRRRARARPRAGRACRSRSGSARAAGRRTSPSTPSRSTRRWCGSGGSRPRWSASSAAWRRAWGRLEATVWPATGERRGAGARGRCGRGARPRPPRRSGRPRGDRLRAYGSSSSSGSSSNASSVVDSGGRTRSRSSISSSSSSSSRSSSSSISSRTRVPFV